MAKQLNVNLNVQANTRDAQKNLQELSATLNKISVSTKLNVNDESLKEAKQAAIDLQQHLNKAINTDTGKLDLNKFSQSLAKSGQDLQSLHNKLAKIGPDGQQAFLRLAQSISQADSSALSLGSKLNQLGTTLKNTARWQISSSILHGFMGALQGAYGYAQDLNQSLNNIRIVTGYNTDQMAEFAEQANKAAKALSTSTTSYTDAALIYYQQGLTGKAVTERVDTTIKLANVSRQSAEEVSSQMTAIWNNFADGSKSLEYYADVITKLGASTASSSDEIAQGLQKFAAVADTVGLSYEKATSALATVVAETRQSADVVGTAFKTMFARFQGLSLGETLEDGVDLNKYSKALATIGVDILNANGELKNMDDILDDTYERWNQISEAQRVALAETVAGTRQYAQFMAIMNNYNKIQENQALASGAEGTLQKQADIYAESWEAASKRVRAAAQAIYSTLIDDKFFITALNGFEKFLTGINSVINGLGGLKGILLLISSIFMQYYAKEIPNTIAKLTSNITVLTGVAEKRKQQQLEQLNSELQSMNINIRKNQAFAAEQQMIQTTTKMTMDLNAKRKQLSATEIEAYETKIRLVEAYGRNTIAIGQEIEALNKEASASARTIQAQLSRAGNWNTTKTNLNEAEKREKNLASFKNTTKNKNGSYQLNGKFISEQQRAQHIQEEQLAIDQLKGGKNLLKELQQRTAEYGKMSFAVESAKKASQGFQKSLDEAAGDTEKMQILRNKIQGCADELKNAGLNTDDLMNALANGDLQKAINLFETLEDDGNKVGESFTDSEVRIQQILDALKALGADSREIDKLREAVEKGTISQEEFNARIKELASDLDSSISHTMAFSEAIGSMVGFMSQVAMMANALKNIGSIWSNENLTDGEKMLQTLTSLTTILPTVITLLNAEKVGQLGGAAAKILGIKATVMQTNAEGASIPVKIASGNAGWFALGPLLLFVGIAAAVVAAIVLITKKIETQTEKLKRLKKEQEELNEVTEKANEEWSKFKENLSNYDKAIQGLSELTKGTEEFNEKLKEANDLAKELITKLSMEFGKDYYYNDQGVITFTRSGRQRINEANQRIASGQRALSWAQNEKDREVQAQNKIVNDNKQKKEKYDYVKKNFGVSYGDNTDWTSVEKSIVKRFGQNGVIDLDSLSVKDLANYLTSNSMYGNSLKADKADAFATYIIESLKEQNLASSFSSKNYGKEKSDIAEFLGAENPYANLIADSFFNTKEEIDKYTQQAKDQIASSNIDQLWEDTFGMLGEEEQEKLIKQYGDKSAALVPGILSSIYEGLASTKTTEIEALQNEFSDNNKDILINILSGQLGKISPDDIKNLTISSEEATAFSKIWQKLYGESLTSDQVYQKILNTKNNAYDPSLYYKNAIQGIEKVQEQIKTLDKTFASLEIGDTVDSLEGLSTEAKSYFAMMEDGTYKLIGNAEQFQAVLFREKSAKFESEILNYQNLRDSDIDIRQKIDLPEDAIVSALQSGVYDATVKRGLTEEEQLDYENQIIAYAALSNNLQQLNVVKEKYNECNIEEELQIEAINYALQDLATKYDTCKDELNDFQFALTTNNDELIAAAAKSLEYSIQTAELAEKMGLSVDDIEDQARAFQESGEEFSQQLRENVDDLTEQQKVATKMAVLNQTMNKGVTTLAKNWEAWKKVLDSTDKTSMDYIDTIQDMKSALKDLLGLLDENLIPDDFFKDINNIDLMGKAAEGDVQSINLLGTAFAKAAIEQTKFADGMKFDAEKAITENFTPENVSPEIFTDAELAFNTYRENVLEGITLLEEKIKDGTIEVGDDLAEIMDGTGSSWIDSLNQMAIATGMSVDEMKSMLNALGIEAEVVSEEKPVHQKVPKYYTKTEVSEPGDPETGDGRVVSTSTWQDGYDEFDGIMEVAQINMGKDNQGKKPTFKYAGRATPAPSTTQTTSKGSGGGSKSKTSAKEHKQPTEEEERYHVLNEQLDDLSRAYDKASAAKERLYGANRLRAMKAEDAALQNLIKHNQQYLKEIRKYLSGDKDKLVNGGLTKEWVDSNGALRTFASAGLNIELRFDDNGNLLNYDEYMQAIVDAYNKAVDTYNQQVNQENLSDEVKNEIEDTFKQAEMQYELAKKALDQYEETNNKFQEKLEEIRDSYREQQDKRLEEWSYKLELKIKINEEDKRALEYFRKSLQRFAKDVFAPVTELLTIWNDKGQKSDWSLLKEGASDLLSAADELLEASHGDPIIDPNTGEVLKTFQYSQEGWMSSLDECEDKLYAQIDAIYELDDTMTHYYADTLVYD